MGGGTDQEIDVVIVASERRKFTLQKFYGRRHDLDDRYGISESQMTTDMFHLS